MAKATVTVVPPVPVKPIKRVTFELSEAETMTLAIILRNIGGRPSTTARQYAHAIQCAIPNEYKDSVADAADTPGYLLQDDANCIYFTDASKAFVESV